MPSTSIKPSQVARPRGHCTLTAFVAPRHPSANPGRAPYGRQPGPRRLRRRHLDPPALRVGSTTTSNATITHWMDVANATDQKSVVDGVDLVRVALKPPQFSACVKRRRLEERDRRQAGAR